MVLQWIHGYMDLFEIEFCQDICPEIGLLHHMGTLVFRGTSILFFIVAMLIKFPWTSMKISFSFHPLQHLILIYFLMMAFLSVRCYLSVVLTGSTSLIIREMHHFICYWPSLLSLDKCISILVFCLIFDWVVWFFVIELHELFIYFPYQALLVSSFTNIFSRSVDCLFILFMASFAMQKILVCFSLLLIFFLISITLVHWP